jgi:hypothetical protein
MTLLSKTIINTRKDLDAVVETPEHAEFMAKLKGSMFRKQDVQVYPEGYNQPGYDGPKLDPIWEQVEDLSTIHAFGCEKSDFAGL